MKRGAFILIGIVISIASIGQNNKTFYDNSFKKGDIIRVPTIGVEVLDNETAADVQDDSLELLVTFLTIHSSLKVELGCHTDSRGNVEGNKQGSQHRAQGIRDFLVNNKNINPDRITAKGYGEAKPIISDQVIANGKTKEEKERLYSINRRIELTVLEGTSSGTLPNYRKPTIASANKTFEKGDLNIAGNLLYGEGSSKPLVNTKVNYLNEKKEIVQTATTNAFGAFAFTNMHSDKNFSLKVEGTNSQLSPGTKITITNKAGKEMQTTKVGDNGDFSFSFLAQDKTTIDLMSVEYKDLRFDLKGKVVNENKTTMSNAVINLLNEKGEIVLSTKADKNGSFQFLNLRANQDSLFSVSDPNTKLIEFNQLFLADEKGNIIKEFTNNSGSYKLTVLPGDENKVGQVYLDDPWLKVLNLKDKPIKDSVTISENIYYNSGEYQILPEAKKQLDKIVNIMKNDPQLMVEIMSHTDSRSSSDYNMKLSQDRAKATVDYFIAQGIPKERVSGKGYGETRLINKCADGVPCTDEEHAKNRRTEFKIFRKQK